MLGGGSKADLRSEAVSAAHLELLTPGRCRPVLQLSNRMLQSGSVIFSVWLERCRAGRQFKARFAFAGLLLLFQLPV